MEEKLPFLKSDQICWSSVIFVDQTEREIELELVASTFTKCLRVGLPLQPHLVPSPTHHVKDRIFLFLSKLIIACIWERRLTAGRRSSLAHNFLLPLAPKLWISRLDHGHSPKFTGTFLPTYDEWHTESFSTSNVSCDYFINNI